VDAPDFYSSDFLREIIPGDVHESWMRSAILLLIIAFSISAHRAVRDRTCAEEEKERLAEECEKALSEVERLSGLHSFPHKCAGSSGSVWSDPMPVRGTPRSHLSRLPDGCRAFCFWIGVCKYCLLSEISCAWAMCEARSQVRRSRMNEKTE
jgi:hypothetical protein